MTIDEVTLDTTIDNYAREEAGFARNARAVANWLEDLEDAGVDVQKVCRTELSEWGGEVEFTITLRQAMRLEWLGWDEIEQWIEDALVRDLESPEDQPAYIESLDQLRARLEVLRQQFDQEEPGWPEKAQAIVKERYGHVLSDEDSSE